VMMEWRRSPTALHVAPRKRSSDVVCVNILMSFVSPVFSLTTKSLL